MWKILALLVLLCIHSLPLFSQKNNALFIDASAHYGFVIVHSRELVSVKNSYPFGLEVGIGKQFISKEALQICNCAPKFSFNLQAWDYGNEKVLGQGAFLNFLVEAQFLQNKRALFPSASFGTGLVYGSNPYDEQSNPNNLSYSTVLSFGLSASASLNYKLDQKTNIFLRANYNHSSNGGRKQPNKGINFPTASLGLSYYAKGNVDLPDISVTADLIPEKKYNIELRNFIASSRVSGAGDAEYFIGGFEFLYSRWVKGVHTITLSNEWVWDTARKKRMELSDAGDRKFVRSGILLGHEFLLSRVTFRTSIGVYVLDDFDVNDDLYQRYVLQYRILDHVHFGLALKAHRHVADFLDAGLAIRL